MSNINFSTFNFIVKEVEKAGFEITYRNPEGGIGNGALMGKCRNNITATIIISDSSESKIKLSDFGHLELNISNKEIFNFIHQISK